MIYTCHPAGRLFSALCCVLFISFTAHALDPTRDPGFRAVENMIGEEQYEQAIPILKKLNELYPDVPGLQYRLAFCYYQSADQKHKAYDLFDAVKGKIAAAGNIRSNDLTIVPVDTYYYMGMLAVVLERYDAGKAHLKTYLHAGRTLQRSGEALLISTKTRRIIEEYVDRIDDYKLFVKELHPYYVKKLEHVNKPGVSELDPVLFQNDNTKAISSVYDLGLTYQEGVTAATRKTVGSAGEIGNDPAFNGFVITWYDKTNDHVILKAKDTRGKYDLFQSMRTDGKWSVPQRLNVCKRRSNETSGYILPDGKTMLFASDRKKGEGGYDIWISHYNAERKRWHKPVNGGKFINTEFNEISIYPSGENAKFYFASDAPKGIGGYDIYENQIYAGKVSHPKHLQYPVNSAGDDLNFVSDVGPYHVFASNRGGKDFDLYYVDTTTPVRVVQLVGNVPDEAVQKTSGTHTDVVIFEDLVNVIEKVKNSDLKTAVKTIEEMDTKKAIEVVSGLEAAQALSIMESVAPEKRNELLAGMEVEKAVDIIDAVSMSTAVDVISSMSDIKSVQVIEEMDSVRAFDIMNQLDLSKAVSILEDMEVEKAVDVIDEFATSKAIDIIDKMTAKNAAAIVNKFEETKATEIIEGVGVDRAVEVLGGIDQEKATRIVDRFKAEMETGTADAQTNSKVMAIIKSYFADQVKIKESVIFKTVYFNFNSSELLLLTRQELQLLVTFMSENQDIKIEVVGHTDNIGDWDANLKVSHDRANEVFRFLRNNQIERERIIFYGKGPASPIALNESDDGRQQNRRVEVILLQ
jgi:outer membrane protein OmpA-like peptidoglycan-associated protein